MSTTQNIVLTSSAWVEVPETDCVITIECNDNKAFLFWTDGAAVPANTRGHWLDQPRVASISALETLWVSSKDGEATITYTVES